MGVYIYTNQLPWTEWTPLIAWDYTLLRWPCDEGFHVPLIEERQAIANAWLTVDQFMRNLHIPLVWHRSFTTGQRFSANEYAHLRASNTNSTSAYNLLLSTSTVNATNSNDRALWSSIRWFRNIPIIPDEDRKTSIKDKVRYCADLISVLVWTNQYVTLQNKNVGATTSWNSWDTLTNANRGKYFQRWNNYWFERGSSEDTSSTQVDASSNWPNDPYSSDTFIIWSSDWSSVQNNNLRWHTDFTS